MWRLENAETSFILWAGHLDIVSSIAFFFFIGGFFRVMGTNYYCETGRMLEVECDCGFLHTMPESLHIGKSSYGWKFSLHAIPEKGLLEWHDWEALLRGCRRIHDEYGDDISLEDLQEVILHRDRSSDLGDDDKERMRTVANRHGYLLDEQKWLYCGQCGCRQGVDGDYVMVDGEFS